MATRTASLTLTDTTFQDQVLHNPQPVLVDFWAPWCGPCHVMAPVIEELATAFAERVTYGIRSIPTLLVFKDGEVVDRAVGVVPKQTLIDTLEAHSEA
jgi:thioredoxin 1